MPKKQRPYPLIHAPIAAPYPPVRQACRTQLQQSQSNVPRSHAPSAQHQTHSPSLTSQQSIAQQQAYLWTNTVPSSVPMTRELRGIPPPWPNYLQHTVPQRQRKDLEELDLNNAYRQGSPVEQEERHANMHSSSPRSSMEPLLTESEKPGAVLRKGRWSRAEDERLMASIELYGPNKWKAVASDVGTRTGDQCWKRWNDSLDPTLKHDPWTEKEDESLLKAVRELGRAWSRIATERLNGRSGLSCKNRIDHLNRRHRRVMNFNSGHILHKLNVAMNRGGCVPNVTLMQKKDSLQEQPAEILVHTAMTPFDPAQAAANQPAAHEARAEQEAANAMYNNLRYDPMMPFSLTHNRDNVQANLETSAAMAAAAANGSTMDSAFSLEDNVNGSIQPGGNFDSHPTANAALTVPAYANSNTNAKLSYPRASVMTFNPHTVNFDEGYRRMVQQAQQAYRGRYPTVRPLLPPSENVKDGQWTNAGQSSGDHSSNSMHSTPIEATAVPSSNTVVTSMAQQSPVQTNINIGNGRMTEFHDPMNPSVSHALLNRPIDANTYVYNGMAHIARPPLYPNVQLNGGNAVQYASSSYPSSQQSNISMMSSPVSEMSQAGWNVPRDMNRGARNPLDIAALTSPTNVEPMGATSSRRPTNFIDKNRLDASYYATAHHAASIAHLISPEIPASVDNQMSAKEGEDVESGGHSSTSFSMDSQQNRRDGQSDQSSVIHQNVHIHGYDDSEFVHQEKNVDADGELDRELALESGHPSGQGNSSA
ncbi:uncharacterized protein FA14DRAFT_153764 [Meira miltonrushii]|uniref:Uncharacterized protein n=1 Tax=Meira miltonrushii TaxID=1280837 RepID=A0A316VMC6_9BASI|nr:uncharacterized protein FA14DRAFT_153764 [Meira miltonrushii]PWN38444.1 hypothetical protein FA14DRAFT_153764 [Meira miltonrushii]